MLLQAHPQSHDPAMVRQLEQQLLQLRGELDRQHRVLLDDVSEASVDPDLSDMFDDDLASDARAQRDVARALAHHNAALRVQVERALQRIGDGSYGRCAVCGSSISPERLEVLPATDRCRACAV